MYRETTDIRGIRSGAVVRALCLAILVTTTAALIGWIANVDALKSWHPGRHAMNPMSALTFIAAAFALRLNTLTPSRRKLALVLAICPLAIGAVNFAHYQTGLPIEADRLLFPEKIGINRMAPSTALAFLFAGCSLLIIDVRVGRWRPAELLAIAGLIRAMMAVVGWVYGESSFYIAQDLEHGAIVPAVNTTFSFLLLNLGILASRPNAGITAIVRSDFSGGRMMRRLLPVGILIPIVLGLVWLDGPSRGTAEWESRAFFVVAAVIGSTLTALLWTASTLNRVDAERQALSIVHRRTESEIRDLFDNAPCGYATLTDEGGVSRINRTMARWIGAEPEEILGRPFQNLLEDSAALDFPAILKELRRNTVASREFELKSRRGVAKPVAVHFSPFQQQETTQLAVRAAIFDASERRMAEKCLRDSEELHRVTLGNVTDALFITDDDGVIVYVSPGVQPCFGYEPQEAYELQSIDLVLGADLRRRADMLSTDDVNNLEYAAIDRHGRLRDFLVNVHRVSIRGGTRLYVFRDVTLRNAAEADLQRERKLSQHVVEHAPLLIVALRPDGSTNFVNTAVTHLTGYLPEELIGRNWWRLMYPGDSYEQVERLLGNSENFRVREYEMTLTTKDGRQRTVCWDAANMLDDRKRLSTIIGLGRDVTDQKLLEDELRQSQKLEAIGRLAGGIAHDFNNLLTIILGNRDLIADACEGVEAAREPLQELGEAGTRGASLIKQLLTFSRREPASPQVVELNELVASFVPLLTRLLGENIRIHTALTTEASSVEIDPAQFEQILLNLAVNARDAMPEGGSLTIETNVVEFADTFATPTTDMVPGSFVELTVADTGNGMSPSVLAHVFEPFYTTKEAGKGTGMGLATVFGAVRQSKGSITVESKLGEGATFHIYLPLCACADREAATTGGAGLATNGAAVATVLIVEDDASVRRISRRMLEVAGYEVIEAESGEQALALVADDQTVDVLLTDVVLPGISGPTLAEQLISVQDMKVVLMSGYSNDESPDVATARADGRFLQKPFSRCELLDAVTKQLAAQLV